MSASSNLGVYQVIDVGTETLEKKVIRRGKSWMNGGEVHAALRELTYYVMSLEARIEELERGEDDTAGKPLHTD